MISRNKQFSRKFIVANLSLSQFIPDLSLGNIRCPFHDDSRPSARYFNDADGDRVFCHKCNRQFDVYDYIWKTHGDPMKWILHEFPMETLLQQAELFDLVTGHQAKKMEQRFTTKEGESVVDRIKRFYE